MRAAWVSLVAASCALLPATAHAHGGVVAAHGSNDAYTLTVRVGEADATDGRTAVDLTAYPTRRSDGRIERDARVWIEAGDDRRFELEADRNGYEVLVPVEDPDVWKSWTVTARVDGPDGSLEVSGSPDGGGSATWLITAGGIAAVLGLVVLTDRPRRAAQPAVGVVRG